MAGTRFGGTLDPMILVLNDHENSRKALVYRLKMEGFETASVESVEDGLAFIEQHPPALVILAKPCGGLEGLGFLQSVRANKALSNLPVYVMSSSEKLRAEAERLGVIGFQVTPIDVESLISTVAATLSTTRGLQHA